MVNQVQSQILEKELKEEMTPLVHQSDTFKIIIPPEVENKIRILCKHIWDVEWSGVLFYKTEGSFEDKSLVVRCVDIYQMDIGSSTYTEFNMSADVTTYMVDNPELLSPEIFQGLIHSHNNMDTFFSSTDVGTLNSEGRDMAHFVSLIVNNAGKYTAGITRKITYTESIKRKLSYPTWKNGRKEESAELEREGKSFEWFNLDIVFENVLPDSEDAILERIGEIKKAKEAEKEKFKDIATKVNNIPPGNPRIYNPYLYGNTPAVDKWRNYSTFEESLQGELPFKERGIPKEEEEFSDIPYGSITVSPDIVQSVVKQLITASAIISKESAINTKKWASSMDNLFKKRFKNMKKFEEFASNYVDFIINSTIDESVMAVIDNDESIMAAILAHDVIEEIGLLPQNPWLDIYVNTLEDYLL